MSAVCLWFQYRKAKGKTCCMQLWIIYYLKDFKEEFWAFICITAMTSLYFSMKHNGFILKWLQHFSIYVAAVRLNYNRWIFCCILHHIFCYHSKAVWCLNVLNDFCKEMCWHAKTDQKLYFAHHRSICCTRFNDRHCLNIKCIF